MSAPKLYASLQIVAKSEKAALNLANGFGAWLCNHEANRIPVNVDWSDDNGSASVRISMSAPDQTELERVKAERDEWKKMADRLAQKYEVLTARHPKFACACEYCEPLTRYNQLKGKE